MLANQMLLKSQLKIPWIFQKSLSLNNVICLQSSFTIILETFGNILEDLKLSL